MLRRTGLRSSPLGSSILLHSLVLAGIAWLGPGAGAALMPPKLVTVEVVTAEPTPPSTPVKPVAGTIAAVKHALMANHSPKVQPTPAPPEPAPPAPTSAPAAKPEAPVAPVPEAAATPNPQPSAGTEALAGGDVSLGRSGSPGARPGQNLAAVGPSTSALGGDGTGSLTSFAVPKGGYQMKPTYPESARRAGIEGTSLLRFEITEGGTVNKITVEKSAGHEELDRAAMAAVKQWRFDPARRGAQAVAVWVTLPVRFELKH
jgi:periplasmic protein TonB